MKKVFLIYVNGAKFDQLDDEFQAAKIAREYMSKGWPLVEVKSKRIRKS